MLTRVLLVLLILSLSINVVQWRSAQNRNTVIAVPDGDSLDLADGRRIRLLGIDAPERGRCMADEARIFLSEQAKGSHVRLKETTTDDYGRTLAIVIKEDLASLVSYLRWRIVNTVTRVFPFVAKIVSQMTSSSLLLTTDYLLLSAPNPDPLLNRAMVRAGLARNRSSTSNPYHQVLKDAQEIARSAKLGIWSDVCRAKTSGNEDCMIKGNTRVGEKHYYLPTCKQYDQVLIDLSFGDRWFCTEAEARSAFFTKASGCPNASP